MKSLNGLLILLIILIIGSVLVAIAAHLIITKNDLTTEQSAPILAIVAGFVVTTVTTFYKEVSSRYEEKRARARNRWQLVFPILKESYIPWKNSAKKVSNSLSTPPNEFTDSRVVSVMYYLCLFYGLRMQFIIKHGGSILLRTRKDEKAVEDAYENIKESFQWGAKDPLQRDGTDTRNRVSELQHYFVKNDLKDDPLVFIKFEEFAKSNDKIKESITALQVWLNSDNAANAKKAKEAFENFAKIFDKAIAIFSGREG